MTHPSATQDSTADLSRRPRMGDDPSDEHDSPARPRQPYEPPRLVVYGDIATLTLTVGNNGATDFGQGRNKRTQP
jgi:hypothetical protein